MICPECGRETSNEQAFCEQCGAYVRSQFGKVLGTGPLVPLARAMETGPLVQQVAKDSLEQLEWSEIEKLIIAEDKLWPTETIFAINADEELDAGTESEADFDDALADDDLEQSLSGRIKREDLELGSALEPLAAEESKKEDHPAPHVPHIRNIAPVGQEAIEDNPFLKTNPDMFIEVASPEAIPEPRPRNLRRAVTIAALAIVPIVFFAGGVTLGVRFADYAKYEIPAQTAVPPVSTEPPRVIPPAGMAYVPGGNFLMGSDDGDTISKPPHFVSVEPFFMDTTEVTNSQYAEFLRATGQVEPRSWPEGVYPEAEANFPVTGITWYEAAEYAAWKGKRLPTEAEWEFAARGTDGRAYPWGDEWDGSHANAGKNAVGLRPVGQGGVSPYGIYDMSGNAWEWTASEWGRGTEGLVALRGGSGDSGELIARCAHGEPEKPGAKRPDLGLRCCAGPANMARVVLDVDRGPALKLRPNDEELIKRLEVVGRSLSSLAEGTPKPGGSPDEVAKAFDAERAWAWRPAGNEQLFLGGGCSKTKSEKTCGVVVARDTAEGTLAPLAFVATDEWQPTLSESETAEAIFIHGGDRNGAFRKRVTYEWGRIGIGEKQRKKRRKKGKPRYE